MWAHTETFTLAPSLVESLWGAAESALDDEPDHKDELCGFLRDLFVFSNMSWITVVCWSDTVKAWIVLCGDWDQV